MNTGGKARPYTILYEDEELIIVNKPSGMLVIPAPHNEARTLTQHLNEELDRRGTQVNAYPCHRLDRETSGVIVYAKGKAMQRKVMLEFQHRKVRKEYLALVSGTLPKSSDTLRGAIYNRNKHRNETAVTSYSVRDRRDGFSVVEVMPLTGKRNQIRIQFQRLGHPLLGERVYAFRRDIPIRFKRVALHARKIELVHPATKKRLCVTVSLPEDMKRFLDAHR